MDTQGFDVLTWRKGLTEDVDPDLFGDLTYTDETGRTHQWRVADTTVDLSVGETTMTADRVRELLGDGMATQDELQQISTGIFAAHRAKVKWESWVEGHSEV